MISHKHVRDLGCTGLFGNFYRSFFSLLGTIFPEFNWDPFSQKITSRLIWKLPEYQMQFARKLQRHFSIEKKRDWYRLSNGQICHSLGKGVERTKVYKMLRNIFPEEDWCFTKFSRRNKQSRQRWLFVNIQEIFKDYIILENFHPKEIECAKTGYPIELDIFLPEINLAFEFHGEQHFQDITAAGYMSFEERQSRDVEKLNLCSKKGIILISIPYWWDNKTESLLATILQAFPLQLNPQKYPMIGQPIPSIPATLLHN